MKRYMLLTLGLGIFLTAALLLINPVTGFTAGTTETIWLPIALNSSGSEPACPTQEPCDCPTLEATATASLTPSASPTETATATQEPTPTPEPTPIPTLEPGDTVRIVVLHRARNAQNELTVLQNMTDQDLDWSDWQIKINPPLATNHIPLPVGPDKKFHKRSTYVIMSMGDDPDPDDDTIGGWGATEAIFNQWDGSNRCLELYYKLTLVQTACPPEW